MTVEQIYDENEELITTESGQAVTGNPSAVVPDWYNSIFEAFMAITKERRPQIFVALWAFYREFLARGLDVNISHFFPLIGGNGLGNYYYDFMTSTSLLSVAGGDAQYRYHGLNSDGSAVYYSLNINLRTLITDPNNFTIAITSMTDANGGIDFGCNDGTNYIRIAARTSGDVEFKAGTVTATPSGVSADGRGVFLLQVSGGTLKGWQYLQRACVQVTAEISMAGSLPTLAPAVCGENNNATPANFSTKVVKNILIYNGQLDDDGIAWAGYLLTELSSRLNTNYET